ncbi:MAG: ImmA/IrrE family metallo-endopeptidase [Bacteroidales bacterium]|nr:ImmA/IrrE family metallo-endopeptidase [Bacteroidales bacterium]
MTKQIPVNPEILVWARETAGLTIEEAATRMNKAVDIIQLWEIGHEAPTYVQLEKLAYQIYKRPLALFFFPEPPVEETPEQSFRTFPEQEIELMSSKMKMLVRKARVMQANLKELNIDGNPAKNKIFKDIIFNVKQSIGGMTKMTREYFGINLDKQTSWDNTEKAFKIWRERLEEIGIYVFKDAFRDDDFSGFCLYDDEFPIIYINNSKPVTRQVFTLFHELAHILFKTGGVDKRLEDYVRYLEGDNRKIEIICNEFAGQFLVPDSDFDDQIQDSTFNDAIIQKLAARYNVSREVILRKYLDRNIINKSIYALKKKEWTEIIKSRKTGGGDYYRNMGVYLSQKYLELSFSHYYQKRISDSQLASYLGVKTKSIPGMEHIMMYKGADI